MQILNSENFKIVYGDKKTSLTDLKSKFPLYEFLETHQTHSDIVVAAQNNLVEADAHFTFEQNKALLIKTADCLPIFVYCKQTKRIAAIHAGWRGVVNKITEKCLLRLIQTGSSDKNFAIYIGPHILQNSFEVDEDVLLKLKSAQYNLKDEDYIIKKAEKYFVDLAIIISSQIKKSSDVIPELLKIDTKTNLNFNSYRRDQTKARNLSFICLTQ